MAVSYISKPGLTKTSSACYIEIPNGEQQYGGHDMYGRKQRRSYFTEFTISKGVIYFLASSYVLMVCTVITLEPFLESYSILPECPSSNGSFENPGFNANPCSREIRYSNLLYLTREECAFGRRIITSVVFGGLIGWERRQADRPAGIRTMSLVSLGSCLFSINSSFAFLTGPMNWDGSRVAAAIPSGVGFLGAALIWKQTTSDEVTGESSHTVHGLTTAASVWLSAAVGIACGGELYFAASFAIAVVLLLLRFGPRVVECDGEEEHEDLMELLKQSKPYGTINGQEKGDMTAYYGGNNGNQMKDNIKEVDESTSLTSRSQKIMNSNRPMLGN
mmetsp:Transcript_10494/g.14817  ORF Transcript_10494/g.14817 Transcript_10494/m.14817 type:complete len:333 (-) Transcript_10494:460-1458(-)|eukprot:CAMPEP_0184865602 /NCGR_PEP_ID=MMETSP0580-20130426/18606_1 /TAXON_ID=1118495 /ORGANISM="Dactyliosolen fragilissimus" /LENGTH=332 /DNA_ID=CAMNT_0027364875 /DNA_START=61 /DNA_END=1059 /DNA_ORIENTATION=+